MTHLTSKNHAAQRGVALVMALVFLTLLTMLGVTSMGTSSLEEKMANNTRDRNLAFQAAETALFAAETWIGSKTAEPTPWPDTAKGLYSPATSNTPNWDSINWNGTLLVSYPCTPDSVSTCTGQISNVATQPKYIIERMGPVNSTVPTTIAYRIIARGTGGSNAAMVMLQSTYIRAYP